MMKGRSETERRLTEAAATIWSRSGFHGASVAEIADAAGVNVSLINRYFGGKEGLFLKLVEDWVRRKQTGQLNYPPQDTAGEEVLAYLRFRYREDLSDASLVRIVISEISVNAAFREQALSGLTYGGDENFRVRLERLKAKGALLPDTDIPDLFRTISLFSFACSFIEGVVLNLPAAETDRRFTHFAAMIESQFS